MGSGEFSHMYEVKSFLLVSNNDISSKELLDSMVYMKSCEKYCQTYKARYAVKHIKKHYLKKCVKEHRVEAYAQALLGELLLL